MPPSPQRPICSENSARVKQAGYVMPEEYLHVEIVGLGAAPEQ